ncbi:16S rRNA (guanine(966)-N(2))-methyltransferase RsmD [Rhodococcus sp. BP-252]|uniref:16S rRNA (guanine(966)-N(2))-methyltransferase RsmD n=1 Tax=unclassified Rhodococcus (in: high G+C Gram-positive bacteria) TaxID=192944 RepID=UPI001C9ADA83|nr:MULTISPECIES: 16S rRNA (guanine(966)-N(2))-methyltransferase RsmD [unclassified Rhodococcus (in: high G+C Gram-positive bacteria)]MBY6411157.1 16S rRNA (guanine(966)-N(2))-methyltransferase RsmD [Rhodococcus sp. BP-320]MBY6415816.1 16S rRNA (guanine(966)-N(2))-methyltransferase RsmD [Rhodococcus sp. BP-321]MBY6424363.1 16S rRNA (guanine(966)-N(2))-methyltransferase RsmD [Rhodococcus sp. BP-324]MBY6425857.1 16S rRNA (guanine(966)-N(2))-methyltransferase RsmD [Rhodococcus sp. BP-323]MBY643102
MTRIVAGIAGGRRLKVPPRGTRPTSERVREALFSSLDSRLDLDGAVVLDLFAGSGALGLEALSRGASSVLLVESDARAASVVRDNVSGVGLAGATVRCAPVSAVLAAPADTQYDLVMADPPYAVSDAAVEKMLQDLLAGNWLAPEAVVVLERSSRSPETAWPDGLVPEKVKKYGETRIEIASVAAQLGS